MPESAVAPARARRRQWGAEKRLQPLPSVHAKPSDRKIILGRLAIVSTIVFWLTYVIYTVVRQFLNYGTESFRFTTEAISYLVVVTFLTFSALMYLVARQGALERFASHVRVPRVELDRHFAANSRSMTVLVPSYSEEPDVIRATLWSAALQEYPSLRVVLLLDDAPNPTHPAVAGRLNRSRAIPAEIQEALSEPASRLSSALVRAELMPAEAPVHEVEVRMLADHFRWASEWLETRAAAEKTDDHVDHFFVEQVLRGLAADLARTSVALRAGLDEGMGPSRSRLLELSRRLAWTFSADLSAFERKRFASLSHEANKAMNLNAYIGLMGARYRYEAGESGTILRLVPLGEPADFEVPDSDYVLTLDADSLLLREYCLRLVYFLEQPGNEQVAVTQTPYSSFRGAPTRIERLAAATTDLQHLLHQGKSYYNATFWVGANAVIRKRALDDIVHEEMVGGFPVRRYVQDRTVIEDTESSLDLAVRGWTLVNYPERLSYSATPPDFGSLVVQRRRWANGGLLILPKLWRQLRDRRTRRERAGWIEFALRLNYMASIAWASLGLVFLLAYPYDSRLLSPVVLLAALPYFLCMASDLKYCGYKRTDVFRIYGFNLILLPVNVAGVLKSLEQAITSKKIPFARTPKVRNRTATPLPYVLAPYAIVAFSMFTLWRDLQAQNWGNAAFAAFNALLALAAIVAYIGIGASIVDIWLGMTKWLYVPVRPAKASTDPPSDQPAIPEPDWRSILIQGDLDATFTPAEKTQPTRLKRA